MTTEYEVTSASGRRLRTVDLDYARRYARDEARRTGRVARINRVPDLAGDHSTSGDLAGDHCPRCGAATQDELYGRLCERCSRKRIDLMGDLLQSLGVSNMNRETKVQALVSAKAGERLSTVSEELEMSKASVLDSWLRSLTAERFLQTRLEDLED